MLGIDCFDWNLNRLAERAIQAGLLSVGSRGHEIIQHVIFRGFESLSPAQRTIYLAEAAPALNEMMRRHSPCECADRAPD
jgi:chorismate synthase